MSFALKLHHGDYTTHEVIEKKYFKAGRYFIKLIKKSLPNTVFVDIGAGVGVFTVLASKLGIQVYVFEPVAINYSLLEKTILSNNLKNIYCYMFPFSDSIEQIRLYVPANDLFGYSVHKKENIKYLHSQVSPSDTFDKYFQLFTNPIIVRINIDGMEEKIINGMKHMLTYGCISHILLTTNLFTKSMRDILIFCGFNKVIEVNNETTQKLTISDLYEKYEHGVISRNTTLFIVKKN